jgi:hypothetical protein
VGWLEQRENSKVLDGASVGRREEKERKMGLQGRKGEEVSGKGRTEEFFFSVFYRTTLPCF